MNMMFVVQMGALLRRCVLMVVLGWLAAAAHAGWVPNADGTVTDTDTGLEWDRCTWGQTWDGNGCVGQARLMDWQQALTASVSASRARHAGQTDWRVPSVKELETLLDLERERPAIDPVLFPATLSEFYWSATNTWLSNIAPERTHVPVALGVHFEVGDISRLWVIDSSVSQKQQAYLRLVRKPGVFDLKSTRSFNQVHGLSLSVTPQGGGSLSCTPNPGVDGEDVNCTVAASAGYALIGLLDNGVEVLGQVLQGAYRMASVSGPHALAATFIETATTTQLSVSPAPVALWGETVSLVASVAGAQPVGGLVQFFDGTNELGSAPLAAGTASLSLTTLAAGRHALQAVYAGDGTRQSSRSDVVDLSVAVRENGVCGSAHAALPLWTNPPSAHLCASGTASSVSASPSAYTWTCAGTGGGADSGVCSAGRGYTVTPSAGAHGAISPSTPQVVAYNATPSFTVTPNAGYTASVSGCGGSLTGTTYTTAAVTEACAINASFAIRQNFAEPSPTGSGTVTTTLSGGGGECGFASSSYQLVGSVGAAPPVGYSFLHGVLNFTTGTCTTGGTVNVTLTYPQTLPEGTKFYKYGPATPGAQPTWYEHPATISGNTIHYSVTDGGQGDGNAAAGVITDPAGAAVPSAATSVPTWGEWTWLVLGSLMLLLGLGPLRRQV